MIFIVVALLCVGQQPKEAHDATRRIRLGFTIFPEKTGHHQGEGSRAALIEGTLSKPSVRLLNLPHVPAGTTFARWLRDGSIIVLSTRIKTGNFGSTDSFVVDPNNGKVLSCLTCSMPKTTNGDFVYNEAPEPVYDVQKPNVVRSFFFTTHYGPLRHEDIDVGSYNQMWKVKPDGKHPKQALEFHVGPHGCQVSPNGEWFACESCTQDLSRPDPCKGPSEFCQGIVVTKVAPVEGGVHGTACIGHASQWLPHGVVVWRLDSKGFLYFSQKDEAHPVPYWWNYYDMSLFTEGRYQPTKTIADGVITRESPAWGKCKTISICNPWLYFTAAYTPTGSSEKIKIISRMTLNDPTRLDRLTDKLGQDAGPPAISADGSMIAFLSGSRRGTNTRGSQVWVFDIASKKLYQLTDFPAESEALAYSVSWPAE